MLCSSNVDICVGFLVTPFENPLTFKQSLVLRNVLKKDKSFVPVTIIPYFTWYLILESRRDQFWECQNWKWKYLEFNTDIIINLNISPCLKNDKIQINLFFIQPNMILRKLIQLVSWRGWEYDLIHVVVLSKSLQLIWMFWIKVHHTWSYFRICTVNTKSF